MNSNCFLKHFVIKTNGMRKRRFDRSTVIIKQSEDKNCAMQVMLALHDGTYINAWTNIDTPLLLLASISVTNILRHRKISLQILPYSKNATASLTVSSMRCFLLTN